MYYYELPSIIRLPSNIARILEKLPRPKHAYNYDYQHHAGHAYGHREKNYSLLTSKSATPTTCYYQLSTKRNYATKAPPVVEPPSFDEYRRPPHSRSTRSPFTYTMVGASGVLGAIAAKASVLDFLASLSAAGTVLALAQVEVDLSNVPEGKNLVVKWRGKPIFIRHRTQEEIEEANRVDVSELRDPQKDAERVLKPEWLVMLGICTHLGCVPLGESGEYGGWYCPCQYIAF